MSNNEQPLTYRAAGVNITAGNELVKRIKPIAQRTMRSGVLGGVGGFGALFELPIAQYQHPVLVSGTDGVGTKLKLAIETGNHNGIGIDLVAMCANDIVVCGAEPLFFLDYYATGQLEISAAEVIIKSIASGCLTAGMALVGGETAEMPGLYQPQDYDLAGFAVGIVEKADIINGSNVVAGDCLLGLASSGPHSNGYSLIRKIIATRQVNYDTFKIAGMPLIEYLLQATTIYVKPILDVLKNYTIKAIAHITGGGLVENIPRVLPNHMVAVIDTHSWERSAVFEWLQQAGNIASLEMYRTFNCGIGLVIAVAPEVVVPVSQSLQCSGIRAWKVGHIETSNTQQAQVILR